MPATWDDILQEGSFGGIKFDFVSAKDDNSNDLDVQKFPNRPGHFIQPRARNGISFDVLGIFIEDDYPDSDATDRGMNKLIAKLNDGGVVKEMVHPVFGSIKAACARFVVNHDIEDSADSATIQITFSEHTEDAGGFKAVKNTTPAKANNVRSKLDTVFVALSAVQAATEIQNNDFVLQVEGVINAANSIADSFEATGSDMTALVIAAQSNAVLSKIEDTITQIEDYQTTEAFELGEALLATSRAVTELAQELIEAKPPLSIYVVTADTNLLSFVFDLYGDSSRANEVLALNSFADPTLIPAGTQVQAYAA